MSTGMTPAQAVPATQMISLDLIDFPFVDPDERKFSKDQAETLATSIRSEGLLQPILVRPHPDPQCAGRYQAIFGRHRYEAHKILKLSEIRSWIVEMDDDDAAMARLTENVFRYALSKKEKDVCIRKLVAYHDAKYPSDRGFNKSHDTRPRSKRNPGAENGDPAPAVSSFSKNLEKTAAAVQGVSESTAQSGIRKSRAFNEGQQEVLDEMKVSKGDQTAIAKLKKKFGVEKMDEALSLVASGMDAKDAIVLVAGEEALPKKQASANGKADPKPDSDADLSDAEWLDQECSAVRRMLKDTRHFDATALWYRQTRVARQEFRKAMKPFLDIDLKKNPLARMISKVINVKHPKDWIMCGSCKGAGATPIGAPCNECGVGGFKVEFDYVKSRSPKVESPAEIPA